MMLAARPNAKGAALTSVVVRSLAPGVAARPPARLLNEPRGIQSCKARNSTLKVCSASRRAYMVTGCMASRRAYMVTGCMASLIIQESFHCRAGAWFSRERTYRISGVGIIVCVGGLPGGIAGIIGAGGTADAKFIEEFCGRGGFGWGFGWSGAFG